MTRNYSLKAIFDRGRANDLFKELSARLLTDSAARVESLTWAPATELQRRTPSGNTVLMARGAAGLALRPFEAKNNYHLKLKAECLDSFYADDAYRVCSEPMSPGSCACLLTSCFAGDASLVLEMTSQLDSLSELLDTSPEIHTLWSQFARGAGAVAAYIDREQSEAWMVYPEMRPITVPDLFSVPPSDDLHYSMDLLVERIRRENDL